MIILCQFVFEVGLSFMHYTKNILYCCICKDVVQSAGTSNNNSEAQAAKKQGSSS